MIKYTIGVPNPVSHVLEVTMQFESEKEAEIVCLPVWRPGRYELGNFAKNVLSVRAFGEKGDTLEVSKVEKSKWMVRRAGKGKVRLLYQYYAFQMDAGNSWIHDDQWYVNPVNCLMYLPERMNEEIEMDLVLPKGYKVACSLEKKENKLLARSYYEVADAPLICSPSLNELTYEERGIKFHIWQQGKTDVHSEKIIADFAGFTRAQLALFEDLPAKEYHFLFHFLPHQAYHGVEHANSTVITLGPSVGEHTQEFYENLMGISSHELFHAWNIARIRPKELLPYDFSKETYFETGYVAEGFTTYYGDLMLLRGGVYSEDWYFNELNKLLSRHFQNVGRFNLSVAESSFDLWLDGYQAGVPNRKVSIYVKGAVVALMLDWTMRLESSGKHSLDDLMRMLWEEYWKKGRGYGKEDIQTMAEVLAGADLSDFFSRFVHGNTPIEGELSRLAGAFGLDITKKLPDSAFERLLGFKVKREKDGVIVAHVHPASQAFQIISIDDEILAVNGEKNTELLGNGLEEVNSLLVKRGARIISMEISNSGPFYETYVVNKRHTANETETRRRKTWLLGQM